MTMEGFPRCIFEFVLHLMVNSDAFHRCIEIYRGGRQ